MKNVFTTAMLALLTVVLLHTVAQAQDAGGTTINFSGLTTGLFPVIQDLLLYAVLGLLGWVLNIVRVKFGLDIDQRNRDALHSAAKTGIEAAIAKFGPIAANATLDVHNPTIAFALQHVLDSVPGALKHFGVSIDSAAIEKIVVAKAAEVSPAIAVSTGPAPTVVNVTTAAKPAVIAK